LHTVVVVVIIGKQIHAFPPPHYPTYSTPQSLHHLTLTKEEGKRQSSHPQLTTTAPTGFNKEKASLGFFIFFFFFLSWLWVSI